MFPENIKKRLIKEGYEGIKVSLKDGSVLLEGELDRWQDVVHAGRLAVDKRSRGVLNEIKLAGYTEKRMRMPEIIDDRLNGKQVDVLVIGGGIVGCAILRELSKYDIKSLLVEKEYDVATAQSSRNDGMIHAGIDLSPNSIKVKYNCRGNKMYTQIAKDLEVPLKRVGQYVLYTKPFEKLIWPFLKARAKVNAIEVEKLSKKELFSREPSVSKKIYGATFYPSVGITSPYEMTIAFAENAIQNGASLELNTAVTEIHRENDRIISVKTNRGTIIPKIVINAAGVYSDVIAEMAGDRFFTIHPRKGEEMILDKKASSITHSVLGRFILGSGASHTKGGGIVATIDNNVLVGPNAQESPDREDFSTTKEGFDLVFKKQKEIAPSLLASSVITYFGGIRASTYEEQFIIERSKKVKNFIQAAGIQSPGVTAAPAIAEDIVRYAVEALGEEKEIKLNKNFNPKRKAIPCVRELKNEERDTLIKQNPNYGIIVCRCEEISKGEILDALNRPLKVASIDAVKRRVRAGMGRCQGGFCSPIITKLIAENEGVDITAVTKKQKGSELLVAKNKEVK